MSFKRNRILAELLGPRGDWATPRWVLVSTAAASLLTVLTSFAYAPLASQPSGATETLVEQLAQPIAVVARDTGAVFSREDRVRSGDTVTSLLRRLGIDDAQASVFLRTDSVARALQPALRTGQAISARFDQDAELLSLTYRFPGTDRALVFERTDGGLSVIEKPLTLETRTQTRSGVIRSSLFAAADEIDLPEPVAIQLAEIFGAEIDFHTDLRHGDRFSVVYESYSHDGRDVKAGRVLAAEFINDGVARRAVWYDGEKGLTGYFTPDGHSLKKAFLRSPLEFSRVSSGFSMRFHPILRDWRAHKGVDYAAPIGTKVLATGGGSVEFIGQQRGYGNFVVLRHHERYTTAYAHLNGFAPGLKLGSRVEQGEVIGYVGRTGWATGPHLHYEFRIGEVHQDPLSAELPIAIPLTPGQLSGFHAATAQLLKRMALLSETKIARAD